VKFLVDECLSPTLATNLQRAGHDAVHIAVLGMCGAEDAVVMQVARIQRRVLLSADTDFGELLARSNDDGPSVVLFRGHEVETATMAVTLLANLDQIDELLTAGAIVVILDDRIRVRRLPLGADPD